MTAGGENRGIDIGIPVERHTPSVGVANLATRAAQPPWLPPGGSCHDETSALRNRYFVVTDEGWRGLKVSDSPVGWRKPELMPSI